MANRNFASGGKVYSMHVMPVMIDCNFVVNKADLAGLGITSLKGPLVDSVYMSTSATPAAGSPAPGDGNIVIKLTDKYNGMFLTAVGVIQSPLSGSDIKIDNSAMTAGTAYVITTLGNATAAKWHAIGVPANVTPAVGVAFIAASNGGTGNTLTSRVQTTAASGVLTIEMAGNSTVDQQGQIILQCRDFNTAIVQPLDGSKISVLLYLSNSSVQISGE